MEKMFVCKGCGHIAFTAAPDRCPVCGAPKSSFKEDENAVMPAAKEGKEKHVPVLVAVDDCGLIPGECRDVHVKVGSTPHPMEAEHWIQWIDVYVNKTFASRYTLDPVSLKAAVGVHLKGTVKGTITAIEHCNKHGSWMAEKEI
jgi:superoxide reductase